MRKCFLLIAAVLMMTALNPVTAQNKITLDFGSADQIINKNIYGHFAEHLGRCIYDGIWVGADSEIPNVNGYRKDILEALQALEIPVLRWPGGCFADTYNWKDGVGPVHKRPNLLNVFWGNVVEDNSFGTHEFLELCEILGADAYIAVNMGSGSVREMIEWIEYMTSDKDVPMANWRRENGREKPWNVRFLGVGNENWGCGGEMTPDFYADLLRQYSVYARQYGGSEMIRVGCGSYSDYYDWTDVVMRKAHRFMEAISFHHYTIPTGNWGSKSAATGFNESLHINALKNAMLMDPYLEKHIAIMDKHDKAKRVALYVDEWGIWTDPEPGTEPGFLYQQNSMRDALIAALTFDIFHKHAERVQMANIAQMVNVLQAMILTEGDKMILTPTYHAFKMYSVHKDANYIPVAIESEDYVHGDTSIPAISGTASKKNGKTHVSLSNMNPNKTITVNVDLSEGDIKKVNSATVLTAPAYNAVNTFKDKEVVKPAKFNSHKLSKKTLEVTLPPNSVVTLELQ